MYTQPVKKAKIVSFDLEVAPAMGWFYPPLYETRILKVKERQKLMSFAWQEVGEEKIDALNLSHMKGYNKNPFDDKLLTQELHKVMSEADILLGQNSDNFDIKMANYFFIMNGLEAIPPTKSIDTKKIAKRYFRFMSNSLDNLSEELGYEGKTEITYKDLWVPAFLGQSEDAWKLMDEYCKNDVQQTTNIYLKMRGFMRTHPSLSRISGEYDACPVCGSLDFRVKAYRTSNTARYRQYFCNTHLGYFRDRVAFTEDDGDVKPEFVV